VDHDVREGGVDGEEARVVRVVLGGEEREGGQEGGGDGEGEGAVEDQERHSLKHQERHSLKEEESEVEVEVAKDSSSSEGLVQVQRFALHTERSPWHLGEQKQVSTTPS
jgi:hypothetical protein